MDPVAKVEAQMIKWIDQATYEQLFSRWRFATVGSAWFQGRVGEHYQKVMEEKRQALPPGEYSRISKQIGW